VLWDSLWQGKAWHLRDPSDPPPFPGNIPISLNLFFSLEITFNTNFNMSKHTSNLSESDLSSTKSILKQMARDIQSLTLRQLQHENQAMEEKKERDSYLTILEEELKLVREKDEYIRK